MFFLNRPVLSIVLSIITVLFGLFCLAYLPVEHLPNLSPPTISVTVNFPGANGETIASSVASPLERAIMGAEKMLYMSSTSSTSMLEITATFLSGTDPTEALFEVQKRINMASYSLPEEVKKNGINVNLSSNNILLFVALQDQNGTYDESYLTDYASVHIVPELQGIPGVGEVKVQNAGEYAMRIWLKPDRMAQLKISPMDIQTAILEQNNVYNTGEIGQEPSPPNTKLTIPVSAAGYLSNAREFEDIVLKADLDGSTVYLKDVARVDLGAADYNVVGSLNGHRGSFISIKQNIDANALSVAKLVKNKLHDLSQFFPVGISYSIPYDTTKYIKVSIDDVEITLLGAAVLVSLIIYLFLHRLLAVLIPVSAMVVSIIGTFLGMYIFGYSINVLTLFGLVVAIGIVVDDAIIVVEKVEYNMRQFGLSSKEAVIKTVKDLTGPIIAIVFALFSVFLPVVFMAGVTGQIYKQFAITIVISVVISGFVALTLNPVLSVYFFQKEKKPSKLSEMIDSFLAKLTNGYISSLKWLLRHKKLGIAAWILLILCIWFPYRSIPRELIPNEDQGIVMISINLPDGASLQRTKKVIAEIEQMLDGQPGIENATAFSGFGGPNQGIFFLGLKDWSQRKAPALQADQIIKNLNEKFASILDAQVFAFNLPPIPNAGKSDTYDFWVVNQGPWSYDELQNVVDQIMETGRKRKEFSYLQGPQNTHTIGMYVDVNKVQAKALGVGLADILTTLQILFSSLYVNDFSSFGKLFKVIMQAEASWRGTTESDYFRTIFVPSSSGNMVPINTLINQKFIRELATITHFNGYPAALISVNSSRSSSGAIPAMEEIATPLLLPGMSYAWSGTAYEATRAPKAIVFALICGVLVLFLSLAALYGRWILPLTVLMLIPFGILGALLSIWSRGMMMDLYFQVGLIASIGISAKNAILIVEAARVNCQEGMEIFDSAIEAARVRLKPILLTSLSLILAVFPLTISTGAGANSQHSIGMGILGGMVVATLLGIFYAPFFYCLLERKRQ